MAVPLQYRLLEIIADRGDDMSPRRRYGSGLLLGDRWVLTAAHVVHDAQSVEVRSPGKRIMSVDMATAMVGDPAGLDLALLRVPAAEVLPDVPIAAVDRNTTTGSFVEGCMSAGYPEFQERGQDADGSSIRLVAQVGGRIPPLANLGEVPPRLSLQVERFSQNYPALPKEGLLSSSPWAGMSGAAVFAGERLVGVVSEHLPRRGPSEVTVTPLSHLLDQVTAPRDAELWWDRLGVAEPSTLPLLPAAGAAIVRRSRSPRLYRLAQLPLLFLVAAMLLRGDTVRNIALVVDGPPMLIESTAGADQEFILAAPRLDHGLAVCSRTDTNWSSSWKGPSQYDLDNRKVESGSLIWSGFPAPEMVFRQGEELFFAVRDPLLRWGGPHPIMLEPEPGIRLVRERLTGASGDLAFIQERPSGDSSDDFLVLTPTTSGDLALYRRDNRVIQFPWTGPELLDLAEPIESVAIAEGLSQDTLEVIGRSGRQLVYLRRDNADQWMAPSLILVEGQPALGASGAIAMIRSSIERAPNLELLVPLDAGGIAHYWRDENDPLKSWHAGAVLGEDEGKFRAVGVVQNRIGPRSELVVVALTGNSLVIFAGSGDAWEGPIPLVCGNRGVRLPDLESPP